MQHTDLSLGVGPDLCRAAKFVQMVSCRVTAGPSASPYSSVEHGEAHQEHALGPLSGSV